MGLDVSHDAWHGAYSAFDRWRKGLAKAADIPLDLLDGYWTGHFIGESDGSGEALWQKLVEDADPLLRSYLNRVDHWLPIKWESLRPDVLHVLLDHSDCDGEIAVEHLPALADRLESLLPLLPTEPGWGHLGDWRAKTQAFIDGCQLAASRGEPLEFR